MRSPHSPHPPAAPPTDRAFRDALASFATGVTIVTARDPQGQPVDEVDRKTVGRILSLLQEQMK